jgi:hypothetical protein
MIKKNYFIWLTDLIRNGTQNTQHNHAYVQIYCMTADGSNRYIVGSAISKKAATAHPSLPCCSLQRKSTNYKISFLFLKIKLYIPEAEESKGLPPYFLKIPFTRPTTFLAPFAMEFTSTLSTTCTHIKQCSIKGTTIS